MACSWFLFFSYQLNENTDRHNYKFIVKRYFVYKRYRVWRKETIIRIDVNVKYTKKVNRFSCKSYPRCVFFGGGEAVFTLIQGPCKVIRYEGHKILVITRVIIVKVLVRRTSSYT